MDYLVFLVCVLIGLLVYIALTLKEIGRLLKQMLAGSVEATITIEPKAADAE